MLLLSLRRAAVTGPWRRAAQLSVVTAAACAALAGFAAPAGAGTGPAGDPFGFTMNPPPGVAAPGSPAAPSLTAPGPGGDSQRRLYVPDLIAAVPSGITSPQLAAISKLRGVQAVLPVDGGKVKVNGQSANLLGVSPQAFRSWTSLSTAGSAAIWSNLGQGQLVSTSAAARRLHLAAGQSYPVSAAVLTRLPFGGTTALSVTGADAMVNLTRSAQLGLARNFAVLISAPPSASLPALLARVKSVIGKNGHVVNLVSYALVTASQRPVAANIPAGAPANYLNLFKASAARMLCADGAGNPATLSRAIFAYNHANWYVAEVLALASEYAKNSA